MVFCHNACSLVCQVNYPMYKFLSVVIVYTQQSNLWSAEHSSQYMWSTTKHETNRWIKWNSLSSTIVCKIYGCVVLCRLISGTLKYNARYTFINDENFVYGGFNAPREGNWRPPISRHCIIVLKLLNEYPSNLVPGSSTLSNFWNNFLKLNLNFPYRFSKTTQIPNIMKILSVRAKLFLRDGRTDEKTWRS